MDSHQTKYLHIGAPDSVNRQVPMRLFLRDFRIKNMDGNTANLKKKKIHDRVVTIEEGEKVGVLI